MQHIILMADIVQSHLYDQSDLMQVFRQAVQHVNRQFEAHLLSPLTITLGDEFQGVVRDVSAAVAIIWNLETATFLQKKPFELRYVLHEGPIDTPINRHIAYEMLGLGLTEARAFLNEMKGNSQRFRVNLQQTQASALLNEAFVIYLAIKRGWNPEKDRELLQVFFQNPDYKAAAVGLGKSRSLMWKRAKSLQIDAYHAVKSITYVAAGMAF